MGCSQSRGPGSAPHTGWLSGAGSLGAAGVIETIACVLAMQEKFFPGTTRLNNVAEGFPASLVKEPRAATRLNHILKVNTGFGGVNGALILSHD